MLSMTSTDLAPPSAKSPPCNTSSGADSQILEYSFEGCEVAVNVGNNAIRISFHSSESAEWHEERDKLEFFHLYSLTETRAH